MDYLHSTSLTHTFGESSKPCSRSSPTIPANVLSEIDPERSNTTTIVAQDPDPFKELSLLDRLLTPFVFAAMVVGVILGEFDRSVPEALNTAKFNGVSVPIAIGLVVMMWPVLTQVEYEQLPAVFTTSWLWTHIGISLILNWIIGPFVMLALAWACLPDLPEYRTGVIMVGLARCIAMVMIWIDLARGDKDYGAILVVINAALQIVLFSPYAILFVNLIGGQDRTSVHVSYGAVAISVLIYLGIPLVAGVITRYGVISFTSKDFFQRRFLLAFSPLSSIGLLYTILVLFAYQGHRIIHNIGSVLRVFVPQILYFIIMWTSTFFLILYLSRREGPEGRTFGYEMAVVQAFTAASNNFELAIAVAISVYGIDSEQALAATIGSLTEVPVLLSLSWLALYLRHKLNWGNSRGAHGAGLGGAFPLVPSRRSLSQTSLHSRRNRVQGPIDQPPAP